MYYLDGRRRVMRSDIGGCHPCNDDDPQNRDDEAPTVEELEPDVDEISWRKENNL